MRKAMICVCFMLALLQVWPMIFGHRAGEASAAVSAVTAPIVAPKPVAAVAVAAIAPAPAQVSVPGSVQPKSCYKQYEAVNNACSRGDQACHAKAADKWDLCEATGFWPS